MSQMLPRKKGKTIWGSDMSDFFLWFCERGYCQRAAHQPKTLSAQEGGLAMAAGSAPLGPQPHEKKMTMLSLSDRGAKVGPNWAARGPKGPLAQSLKEYPLTKEVLVPQKGFKTLPKSAGSREEATKGQLVLLEDAASGKSNRALEAVPKGFGARVSHPPGSQDKQLALIPKTRAREPVQASHIKARGDSPGVASKVPLGTFRLGYVMLKRTKKPPRQALFLKGPTSAAAHGSMDVKRKPVHRSSESSFLNLAELQPGDLIEIFRFGYQHWAIYVGDGYVIHLAPPTEFAGAGCASLMSTLTDKALVKKELLEVVVGKNRYRVNNKHDNKHPPLPIPKIVRRAEEMVGRELQYKVTSENCEHFVTELRYGVPRSDQVRDALVGVGVAGLGLAALGIIGTVMRKKKQQNQ